MRLSDLFLKPSEILLEGVTAHIRSTINKENIKEHCGIFAIEFKNNI